MEELSKEELIKKLEASSHDDIKGKGAPPGKAVLITLGGIGITDQGKLTKSKYFEFLTSNTEDYTDIVFTKDEAEKVSTHLRKMSTGSTIMAPIRCGGEATCPVANTCPLVEIGKAPLGRTCPIESQLLQEWTLRYMNEFDVDVANYTEVTYAMEIAEIELTLTRINQYLSSPENAMLMIDQVVGFSNDTAITQKQLNPLLEKKERLNTRKSKIIKLMVGDRQEKYKKEAALKAPPENDPSVKMAEMRAKLESLQRGVDDIIIEEGGPSVSHTLTPQDIINNIE